MELPKRGRDALEKLLKIGQNDESLNKVLDLGSGNQQHTKFLRSVFSHVDTLDFNEEADYNGDFMDINFPHQYDVIWCCHVLEHQRNVGLFLEKINDSLRNNGILAITIPPHKDEIVGGHVSLWNTGLLLYNLILAEFNCKNCKTKKYGRNISVILQKEKIILPENLQMGRGDIEKLTEFWPSNFSHGFNGDIDKLNWSGYDNM